MNELVTFNLNNKSPLPSFAYPSVSKFLTFKERKMLKLVLLNCLHELLIELFQKKIQSEKFSYSMESYAVDSRILQFIIESIVETGEYTLEGIAHYTRIPFDVIFDAACGNNTQLSITLWIKIVDLYMQIKPELTRLLFNKLIEIKDQKYFTLSLLLNDQ